MNTPSAEGLPELPEPLWRDTSGLGPGLFTADQMRAYGELCRAAPAGGDDHLRRLVGKLDQWRLSMSYNDSYFGEPAGLLKSTAEELARAVGPIYPPKPAPKDPLAGVTIYSATVTLSAAAPAVPKDSAPAGSGEVEDWMVELFDEVYEREWNRAADEADDRHKAIIGPADHHATREAIAALLRKLQQGADGRKAGFMCIDTDRIALVDRHDWPPTHGFRNVWVIPASQGQEGV